MTIYSLDILLSWFGASLLFHVQFYLLPLDQHTDFSECWDYSPGIGNGNSHQSSCPENPMDTGAWLAVVQRITESDTTGHWPQCRVRQRAGESTSPRDRTPVCFWLKLSSFWLHLFSLKQELEKTRACRLAMFLFCKQSLMGSLPVPIDLHIIYGCCDLPTANWEVETGTLLISQNIALKLKTTAKYCIYF